MEKLTLEDFLKFPGLNMTELRTFFKDKDWLRTGDRPDKKTFLERIYQQNGEMHSFVFRISKKTGHSWTLNLLVEQGEFQKRKFDILRLGYSLTHDTKEEDHQSLQFRKDNEELKLEKFPDLAEKENFKLTLKITEHNTK